MPTKQKDKQQDSSNLVAPTPQAAPTQQRTYTFADLSLSMRSNLQGGYDASYQNLIDKIEKETVLSESSIKEAKRMIIQFSILLDLCKSDEKFKNFNDGTFNTAYFQAVYGLYIANLALKLDDKKKAEESLGLSMQAPHSRIIQNYVVMVEHQLPKEEEATFHLHIAYRFNIIKYSNISVGSAEEREERQKDYQTLGFANKQEALKDFAKDVFAFYFNDNNTEKVEELLSIMAAPDTSLSLKEYGKELLFDYLYHFLNQSNFQEIDRLLIKFQPLVAAELYLLLANALCQKMNLDPSYQKNFYEYLEKGLNLADTSYTQLKFAELLITQPPFDTEKITKGLQLVKTIQKDIKKKGPTYKPIKSQCFYLLGLLHGNEELPDHFDIKLAIENYTRAIQLNDRNSKAHLILGLVYKGNIVGKQDLNLATRHFEEAAGLGELEAHLQYAEVQLMQATTLTSDAEREALLLRAREHLLKLASFEDSQFTDLSYKGRIHNRLALIGLFLDFNLKTKADESTGAIASTFSTVPLYAPARKTKYKSEVEAQLRKAIEYGDPSSTSLLGILLHHGTYLEQNLDSAESFYKACKVEENLVATQIQLLELYLLKMSRAANKNDRETYLLKALNLHSILLKTAYEEGLVLALEASFNKLMTMYRGNYSEADLSYIQNTYKQHRLSTEFQVSDRKSLAPVLKRIIDSVLPLLKAESDKPEDIANLLKSFHGLRLFLKKTKTYVPAYLSELRRLPQLEITLPYYHKLPKQTQIDLIHNYASWPLIQESDGLIRQLLISIRPQDLAPREKIQFALALTHFKHEGGLFENELMPILADLIKSTSFDDISQLANLMYLFAILHANGSPELKSYVTLIIEQTQASILRSLESHCWEANQESMSQIYHGLNYLKQFYPKALNILPGSGLKEFITFYEKLLSSDQAVNVSRQQQEAFNVLSRLNHEFQHEPMEGGRRVDFYNPRTKEVVLFHGPTHYLFSKKGNRIQKNAATVLNEKTLEAQGFKVISIPYYLWDESSDKRGLLVGAIPSLNHLRNPRTSLPSLGQGQLPHLFWATASEPSSTLENKTSTLEHK